MRFALRHKPQPQIPVASMADIAMLLTIFFLVTSRLMNEAGIKVKPPYARYVQRYQAKEKSVIIDEKGGTYFNGVRMAPKQISSTLLELIPQTRTAPEEDRLVTVKCDGNVPYGDLTEVVGAVSQAGAVIVLVTEPERSDKR